MHGLTGRGIDTTGQELQTMTRKKNSIDPNKSSVATSGPIEKCHLPVN